MGNIKDQVIQAQKCENLSDFLDVYFTEPVAMCFSKLFIKLKLSPNIVTFFSLIFGVVGGAFFYFKKLFLNIIGIVLEIFGAIFDTSDGQVARLTHKKSDFGRVFDGVADGLVYFSIYFFISLRLMDENIPFTNTPWGWYIWIISFFCGLILHSAQARMADYFKNIHMYFKLNERGNDLSISANLLKEIKKEKRSITTRIRQWGYYFYTKMQEMGTPNLQKLLLKIEDNGGVIPKEISEQFTAKSNKIIKLTNFLTFNFRSYILFALILFSCHFYIFPVIVLIIEPISFFIKCKYEKIAKNLLNEDFYIKAETNEI